MTEEPTEQAKGFIKVMSDICRRRLDKDYQMKTYVENMLREQEKQKDKEINMLISFIKSIEKEEEWKIYKSALKEDKNEKV